MCLEQTWHICVTVRQNLLPRERFAYPPCPFRLNVLPDLCASSTRISSYFVLFHDCNRHNIPINEPMYTDLGCRKLVLCFNVLKSVYSICLVLGVQVYALVYPSAAFLFLEPFAAGVLYN